MDNEVELYIEKWIKSRSLTKVPAVVPNKLLGDKEFVIGVLDKIPLKFALLEALPASTKNDKDVVRKAVKSFPANILFVPDKLFTDKELVKEIVPDALLDLSVQFPKPYHNYSNGSIFRKIPPKVLKSKDVALSILSRYGFLIDDIYEFGECDDIDIASAIVNTKHGWYLYWCSKRLLDDKDLVTRSINSCGCSILKWASDRLKDDKDVMLEAVKHGSAGFEYASDRLKDDKDVALLVVAHDDGYHQAYVLEQNCNVDTAYKYLSDRLKNDKDVAYEAIKTNLYAYKYAPKEIKLDPELALIALSGPYSSSQLGVPSELFTDKEFILKALPLEGRIYECVSPKIRNDEEVINEAIRVNPGNYRYLPIEKQFDKDIILNVAEKGLRNLYPASGKVEKKDDKNYLVVTFNKDSIIMAANLLKGFSGYNTTKEEQEDIIRSSNELIALANEQGTKVIELPLSEEYSDKISY